MSLVAGSSPSQPACCTRGAPRQGKISNASTWQKGSTRDIFAQNCHDMSRQQGEGLRLVVTKRRVVGILLALALCAGTAVGYLAITKRSLPGSAIDDGSGGDFIMLPVMLGDRVFLEGSFLGNRSQDSIRIISAEPSGHPVGVEFVGIRLYQNGGFPNGAPPGGWSSSDRSLAGYDPGKRPSKAVIGRSIAPGFSVADHDSLTLLEFRAVKPGTWRWRTQVTYSQEGLFRYRQTVGATYELRVARTRAEWRKLAS